MMKSRLIFSMLFSVWARIHWDLWGPIESLVSCPGRSLMCFPCPGIKTPSTEPFRLLCQMCPALGSSESCWGTGTLWGHLRSLVVDISWRHFPVLTSGYICPQTHASPFSLTATEWLTRVCQRDSSWIWCLWGICEQLEALKKEEARISFHLPLNHHQQLHFLHASYGSSFSGWPWPLDSNNTIFFTVLPA